MFILRTKNEIVCKSYMIDSQEIALRYDSKASLEQQHNIYCCENYRYCEQYLSYQHFRWEDS